VVLIVVSIVVLFSLANRGQRIFIHFDEGHGLKSGDAVRCRGITVGEVRSVELSADLKGVDVVIDLRPRAGGIAVEGSRFWIVRPRAGLTGVSGLDTVVGAKYVAVNPGKGKAKRSFDGLNEEPVDTEPAGLNIVLEGKRMGGLRPGVPLFYRQKRIGSVVKAKLVAGGRTVEVHVYVEPQYKKWVYENSEFWNVSGFRLQGSVVSGLTFSAESAETLLAGGVAMVTFGTPRASVSNGHRFPLADEPPKEHGDQVFVHFKEGHGLKPGDVLRHRGITLGEVRSVELSRDRKGVDVVIDLRPTVRGIAVEGSRFWIVRPQATLTGVSGLDTVVGSKYVAVSPGSDTDKVQQKFDGEEAPVFELEPGGLQIVVQDRRTGGLRPGAPLTYRGVRIGIVLSAGLASDTSAVDVHVHVLPAYKELVRENSVFWNVSGIKVGGVFRRLALEIESAEAVLAGGMAMATPTKPGKPARDGKRFTLKDKEPDDLLKQYDPSIPLIDPRLPEGVTVPRLVQATLQYRPKRILAKLLERRGLLLPVGTTWLLGPEDLLSVPNKGVKGKGDLALEGESQSIPADNPTGKKMTRPLRWLEITEPALRKELKENLKDPLPKNRLRHPTKREDCLLVANSSSKPIFISTARLKRTAEGWTIAPSLSGDLTPEQWHGAAAVSVKDGAVIGLLQVPLKKGRKLIIPLPEDLLRQGPFAAERSSRRSPRGNGPP
jgi:paraquat-inducible protein B